MARPRGFASGDFDPAYALDDKFRSLAAATDRRTYLAAEGLWWELVAAAWRDAQRASIERAVPDSPADLVELLRKHRLIDSSGRLPRSGYNRWIGAALARRQAEADRKARQRGGRSRDRADSHSDSVGNEMSPPERMSRGTPAESLRDGYRSDSPSSGDRSNGPELLAGAREGLDLDSWAPVAREVEALTRRPNALSNPYGKLGEMARALVDDFGLERTVTALRTVASGSVKPDASVLVLGANRVLRPLHSPRELERSSEAEAERRRQAASLERTAALIREHSERAAETGSTNGSGGAYDAPRRVGDLLAGKPQVRGSHS